MSINFGNNDQSSSAGLASLTSNPTVLYGAIAGVAVLGLSYLFFSSNSDAEIRNVTLSSGQSVVLENPNGGLSHITAGPGMMSASVSEEDRDQSICTATPGTHGVVEELQIVESLAYVKVRLTDGGCEGKSGWTTKMNVRAGA
jgi:hypothetical protein